MVKKLFIQSFSIKRTQHRPKIRISSPLVMTSFYCAHTNISTSPLVVGAVNHKKNPKVFFGCSFQISVTILIHGAETNVFRIPLNNNYVGKKALFLNKLSRVCIFFFLYGRPLKLQISFAIHPQATRAVLAPKNYCNRYKNK